MIIHPQVLSICGHVFHLRLQNWPKAGNCPLWKIKMIYGHWIDFSLSFKGHNARVGERFQFCVRKKKLTVSYLTLEICNDIKKPL